MYFLDAESMKPSRGNSQGTPPVPGSMPGVTPCLKAALHTAAGMVSTEIIYPVESKWCTEQHWVLRAVQGSS